jgi:hypothetical protein
MSILDEHEADKIVIQQLLNELKRRYKMSTKLIKNDHGEIVRVTSTEDITRENLVERRDDFQRALKQAEQDVADYDALANPATAPLEVQPAPIEQPQPAELVSTGVPQNVQVIEPAPMAEQVQPAQPPLVLQ